MLLHRIAKTKYIQDLSGEGARRAGGRWNYKGVPVVYAADSAALATLETLVHLQLNLLPLNLSSIVLDLPDNLSISVVSGQELPPNWYGYPAPKTLADIGNKWIEQQTSVALSVPSAILPDSEDRNYLLNPRHPDFRLITIVRVKPYTYDSRLMS
ncbi:MAG: RES family NAD+ phosphorylase [Cyanobacteria bacterium J06600_6]